ncbi:MAG: response regulator [Deltaproteobacteria bacterium]|nr:response regulator [Deltaproteobacteria bacterium]
MKKKILIIDDDVDLVEAMRITLENAGFAVVDAQDGQQGLAKLQAESPDLVILDVMMDTQDEGFHVAYRIRGEEQTRDLPIIMLTAVNQQTGYRFSPDKDEGFLPVDEFLEKPIDPKRLVDKVREHLGR